MTWADVKKNWVSIVIIFLAASAILFLAHVWSRPPKESKPDIYLFTVIKVGEYTWLFTDKGTGCEYIKTGKAPLVPRLGANGKPICSGPGRA